MPLQPTIAEVRFETPLDALKAALVKAGIAFDSNRLDGDRVLMLLRDQSDRRQMRTAYSEDNGWTWSEAAAGGSPWKTIGALSTSSVASGISAARASG